MTTAVQRSFAAGELSPEMQAKSDVSAYSSGLKKARNVIVGKVGGAWSRSGTEIVDFMGSFDDFERISRFLGHVFFDEKGFLISIAYTNNDRLEYFLHEVSPTSRNINVATGGVGGVYPLWDKDKLDEIDVSRYEDGFLLCHENLTPMYLRVVKTGASSYSLEETAFLANRGTRGIIDSNFTNAVVSTGTSEHEYRAAYVDPDGQEGPYRDLSVMSVADLNSTDKINLIIDGIPEGFSTNVYKKDGNSYFLIDSGAPVRGSNQYRFADIGQSLVTSEVPSAVRDTLSHKINQLTGTDRMSGLVTVDSFPHIADNQGDIFVPGESVFLSIAYTVDGEVGQPVRAFSGYRTIGDTANTLDRPFYPPVEDAVTISIVRGFISNVSAPRIGRFYQSRMVLGSTPVRPRSFWCSSFYRANDFSVNTTITDSSPFSFNIKEGRPRSIIEGSDNLFISTEDSVNVVLGNEAGVMTPTQVNLKELNNDGISMASAIKMGHHVVYEQEGGGVIRIASREDIDLSIYAGHLFRDRRVKNWAYVKRPTPMVWVLMEDQRLYSLTFVENQSVLAWTRHDIQGNENTEIHSIASDGEDLYFVSSVLVTGGLGRYYLTSMGNRFRTTSPVCTDFTNSLRATDVTVSDFQAFLDATPDADGLTTIRHSWLPGAVVPSVDVGNMLYYMNAEGRFVADQIIEGVDFGFKVRREVEETGEVGAGQILKGVNRFTPVGLLLDDIVSIVADGNVLRSRSPLGSTLISFDRGYREIQIGRSIVNDIQTVDIDLIGPTLAHSYKNITEVNLYLESSFGLYIGNNEPEEDGSVDGLDLMRPERGSDLRLEAHSGVVGVNIDPTWNATGSIFIRQIDPLPFVIHNIIASGDIVSPAAGAGEG